MLDPQTCRRALREIGEIAAVAVLDGSQMTEQEALQTIAAIAEWVREEAPVDGAPCTETVRSLNALTVSRDFDTMSDWEAMKLFGAVLDALHQSDATAMPAAV
ncbi:hypothetical protein [Brevundimonas sp. NIBR11]|uniref:hypothetical protein n=1 Tax=Brevundimonas sp. NIBR11 TaxID=3015999 RepID=UPI0022F0AA9D|nr:hypothetical protein [Brevundimonas sp. NIBR11]WGM30505.1 hypothetical protein KKHFBJBL_00729 [Brevundimonas sp. NIBR11]